MKVEIVEKIKGEDLLKIENFLKRVEPSFKEFEASYKENPLESFLDYPSSFTFLSPLYWEDCEEKEDLISYEKGKAFFQIPQGKERFLFSFDWRTLYQEFSQKDNFLLKDYQEGLFPKEPLYRNNDSKEIHLSKVKNGKDLVSALTHSTWLWLKEFCESQVDFILFLPFSFYPILKEPSTNSSWDNIEEELKRRLNIKVLLSPSLEEEVILVDEKFLSVIKSVKPCYFIGLDEEGNRRLFLYLEVNKKKSIIPSYSLKFSLNPSKEKNIVSHYKFFTIFSLIFFSFLLPLSWHLIDLLWYWLENFFN